MKNLIICILILLLKSFPSFAKWKKVVSTSVGVYFIETDTIRKNKDITYYNSLTDFYEPNLNSSLSAKYRDAINCKTKKFKSFRVIYFLDSMGKGKKVFEVTSKPKEMIDIKEGAAIHSFYKFICK